MIPVSAAADMEDGADKADGDKEAMAAPAAGGKEDTAALVKEDTAALAKEDTAALVKEDMVEDLRAAAR
jgi:hypothetical protein